ncbi:hypothetical protein V5T82_12905 [Magnetovibrio sp. PR-2]|uniref:hypothetical protein n=1 Tax=Magnetovibrio sp. PR-2 TaxID=3120356 RepID=UPI002FCE14DB
MIFALAGARAYSTVQNTPNSVLFSVARTPDREDLFTWIGTLIDFAVHIDRKSHRADIQLNSEDGLFKKAWRVRARSPQ